VVRDEIWRCIEALKAQGQSILLIDKNMHALKRLADHHYILEKGRTVWSGDGAALEQDAAKIQRYIGI
jgi:branched-chain amino acid transport system ATP-binding protein